MSFLSWRGRKAVAARLLRSVLDTGSVVDSVETLEKLFAFLRPLLKDDEDTPTPSGGEDDLDAKEEFEREQTMVACLVHAMRHEDTDAVFTMYTAARKHFGQGGVKRIAYTLTPLVFCALRLVHRVREREQKGDSSLRVSCRKLLQFVHQIVTAMAPSHPDLALKLFLSCALAADGAEFEAIAYEFVTQAFIIYEDELSESQQQLRALGLMVGALLQAQGFEQGNHDTLVTKTAQYCAKMLKKPDQCRMVSLCAHLFWSGNEAHRDGRRVLECLQRSLKLADVCMSSGTHNVKLFVEILDKYLYFYEKQNPAITVNYLSGLLALINEHIEGMEDSQERAAAAAHVQNTLRHIRLKKSGPEEEAARFAAITI